MHEARHWMASSLLAIAIVHSLPSAQGREPITAPLQFDLPAQPLPKALLAIGTASGEQIIFPGDSMGGLSAPAIQGRMSAEEAIRMALQGTRFGLEFRKGAIFIRPRSDAGEDDGEQLVVTGSRIRGGHAASPVYRYDMAKMRDQGITDMHALAAAIPQNFTGGQSPGIGSGAGSGNGNVDSSTALNLRGLGPGSTLTLLNGHRLAYNLSNQSVDFSSIPFAAVERVEIMPDGASALYGSDAVGGVANIILKSDYRGVTANSEIGAATDGGYVTRKVSLVGGTSWQTGGIVLTGAYDDSTQIAADDRSFTSGSNPHLTLYPDLRSYAFVASAHQDASSDLTLSFDALLSKRIASADFPYSPSDPVEVFGYRSSTSSRNYSIAPSATWRLSDWTLSLVATYGGSHLTSRGWGFPDFYSAVKLDNETISSEFSAEGSLFSLPAGKVRVATGGGYRRDTFTYHVPGKPVRGRQENVFGYAEVDVPLTAPSQGLAALYRASISAALRYEDYPGMGRLATPKLGAIWSPIPEVDLKLSWGRSFKAPTLYQRLAPTDIYLFPGDLWGAWDGALPSQTIININGGKNDLKPEKAQSLSASLLVHPAFVPGLDLGVTYFKIGYSNRIVTPVSSLTRALRDPLFSSLVSFSPDATEIASVLALSSQPLQNQTDMDFDPASVYAIVDGRWQNVARDKADGFDITLQYKLATDSVGTFNLSGNATYLRSHRVLIDGAPQIKLAGTIFNPAHLKLRGGVSWSLAPFLINAVVNHVGGVTDDRSSDVVKVGGLTSFDLSAKMRLGAEMTGFDVHLTALNIFNAKPAVIQATGISATYDSTNYSAIGRYVSLSLTKSF